MDNELQNHFDNEDFIDDKQKKSQEVSREEIIKAGKAKKNEEEKGAAEKTKNKVGKKKVKKTNSPRDLLSFDMSLYSEEKQMLENYLEQANNKTIGDKISKEMILSYLIKMIDDEFIFNLQKESLSPDELDGILKSQFCKIH